MKILASIIFCLMSLLASTANAAVGDATVIDAIGSKPDSAEVVLLLHQMRPWNTESQGLLVKKLDFYQSAIRSGALEKQRPELLGKTFRIVVIYLEAPTEDAVQLLSIAKSSMSKNQIALRWGSQEKIPELVAN